MLVHIQNNSVNRDGSGNQMVHCKSVNSGYIVGFEKNYREEKQFIKSNYSFQVVNM